MKAFMDKDFLLQTETARKLYHEEAAQLPIIDYHCHLDPRQVAEDYRFRTITELWLGGDHYKWRALRSNGVNERYITGDASDWEKFEKWAETMPYCMRNPLYHWTHLELRTAFGIQKILNPKSAREIYEQCNEMLQRPEFSARGLMRHYRVEVVCTTDDPADSLQYHQAYAKEIAAQENKDGKAENATFPRMLPTWRPDKALAIDDPVQFRQYLTRLGTAADLEIRSYDTLLEALQRRHDFFASLGCRLSDHGLEEFYADDFTEAEVRQIFSRALDGQQVSATDVRKYRSALLLEFGRQDHRAGWTQQFHYGPIRNNNTRMMQQLGPDSGFDSIGTPNTARQMARFLDRLCCEGSLPQTILYNINPSDNEMLATMAGNFQEGPVAGKIQFGSGWWFNDQKDGMERQMNALSTLGLLSRFVGMLTDSRSFLSYPRHEYFRRTLCNLLGQDVENGELPEEEMPQIRQMVRDICYWNAKRYFRF